MVLHHKKFAHSFAGVALYSRVSLFVYSVPKGQPSSCLMTGPPKWLYLSLHFIRFILRHRGSCCLPQFLFFLGGGGHNGWDFWGYQGGLECIVLIASVRTAA